MGTGFPDSLIIDPLPHDRDYFADHLAYLNHYYSTVSKSAVSFSAMDIYPAGETAAYRLGYPMWHYNYNTESELLDERLVELFAEAVSLAEADVNFADYDAILVFHAGVGKDFNVGYDNTPFDIPSAYISERDLEAYEGSLPSNVKRGLILPEGQNQQEVLDFGVELSLNGVMIKLFGNWLGLPDLFDTRTGNSAIGRWGMMDQGSGNVNALVPAMPEAWSRVYMGWETPVVVIPPGLKDTLRVARFDQSGAPEILQLAITPEEYYLIENRDSDADSIGYVSLFDRNNREMRVEHDGDIQVEAGFRVAVRASHYDFGIPGSGLLIWHIDEAVIAAKKDSNTVNNDMQHRGVDLVEADGSQDIGVQFGFATAGSGTELGIQDDAWYRDNRSHREANGGVTLVRFNDRSRPPARLYDHAYTYIELTDFSVVQPVMSFTIRSTTTAEGFPIAVEGYLDAVIADLNGDGQSELIVDADDSLLIRDPAQETMISLEKREGLRAASPGAIDFGNDGQEEVLWEGSGIGILRYVDDAYLLDVEILQHPPGSPDPDFRVLAAQTPDSAPRMIVLTRDVGETEFWNSLIVLDTAFHAYPTVTLPEDDCLRNAWNLHTYPATTFLLQGCTKLSAIRVDDSEISFLWTREGLSDFSNITVLNEPSRSSIFVDGYGYIDSETGGDLCLIPDCVEPGVDWDGDGIPDGGGLNGRHVIARENAPQIDVARTQIVDLDIDGKPDIFGLDKLTGDYYSRIYAADHDGPIFSGFPIASPGTPDRKLFSWGGEGFLHYLTVHALDSTRYLSIQRFPIQTVGSERFAFTEPDAIINIGAPRPQVHERVDWLYCWPNPTSDISHLRFTAAGSASATVKIFDLAGRRVASLNGEASAAGQFEVDWNVSGVQSGVYIARAELREVGRSRTSEIKIAVVK